MDKALLEVIHAEAAKRYPNEACGLIVKNGKKPLALACNNLAALPRERFMIDPLQQSEIADHYEIIGIWHTHVEQSSEPSEADRSGCEMTELPWHIVAIHRAPEGFQFSTPVTFEPCGYEAPYLERQYVYGIYDCYSLIQDYYKREFGIALGNYPHVEGFWRKGYNFFQDNFGKEGFVEMPPETELQIGDMLLLQVGSAVPNHSALYIGDELIMHHCEGRLSRRDIYGGYWQKHTTAILRHKEMMK